MSPTRPRAFTREALLRRHGVGGGQAKTSTRRIEALAAAEGLSPCRVLDDQVGITDLAHEFLAHASAQGKNREAWDAIFNTYFGRAEPVFSPHDLLALSDALGPDRDQTRQALARRRYRLQARAPDNSWAKRVSPPMSMTDAARNTLTVMAEQGIRRIALASSQGTGDDWARLNPLMKAFVNLSNIKAGFTDNPATGPLRAADPGTTTPGRWINRADLARFLLDAVDEETWIRRAPLVWNDRG